MKQRSICMLFALAAMTWSAVAMAGGDAAAGKAKSVVCAACHGADGNAAIDPQYPRLAGQYRNYLVAVLREYKDGQRQNPIMVGFAASLTEQDIENLAAYYSSLPGKLTDLHGRLQGE